MEKTKLREIGANIEGLINELTLLGEREKIEAKTGTEAGKSMLQTICAFANEPSLGGGYLLLGVKRLFEGAMSLYVTVTGNDMAPRSL